MSGLLRSILTVYSCPEMLVFLIGANDAEGLDLCNHFESNSNLSFHVIKSGISSTDRLELYLRGGLFSITSRILLIDLLTGNIPKHMVTGFLILHPECATEMGLESFCVALLRDSNKVAFIKAFCDRAEALSGSFGRVERICKYLGTPNLHLYPRFHVIVQESLCETRPVLVEGEEDTCNIDDFVPKSIIEVEEIRFAMSSRMKAAQVYLTCSLEICLCEILKDKSNGLDEREFTSEATLTDAFYYQVQRQLEPRWHLVSWKTKQILSEMRIIKQLIMDIIRCDPVTVCRRIDNIEAANRLMLKNNIGPSTPSYWLELPSSQEAFNLLRARFNTSKSPLYIEAMPKWLALKQLIQENSLLTSDDDDAVLDEDHSEILIMVSNKLTQIMLLNLMQLTYADWCQARLKWYQRLIKDAAPEMPSEFNPSKRTKSLDQEINESEEECEENDECNLEMRFCVFEKKKIRIEIYKASGDDYGDLIHLKKKQIIFLYDVDLGFIRAVEIHAALRKYVVTGSHPEKSGTSAGLTKYAEKIKLITLTYKDSVEEQLQLLQIRQEKEAFEHLIRTRASMITFNFEGRSSANDHENIVSGRVFTGSNDGDDWVVGGGDETTEVDIPEKQMIIVDTRELRNGLPLMLFKRGFTLVPETIKVGDYVLTSEIGVERKSIADLQQSLSDKKGRLYKQMDAMQRKFRVPILLLEFDQERSPFNLIGSVARLSNGQTPDWVTGGSITIRSVLSKLCLLMLHYRNMRIIWSPSLSATAEIFLDLKRNHPQPQSDMKDDDSEDASQLDERNMEKSRIAMEMMKMLPGVSGKAAETISRHVRCLRDLSQCSIDDLQDMIGREGALSLYNFFQSSCI